jgi:hypothetical protein
MTVSPVSKKSRNLPQWKESLVSELGVVFPRILFPNKAKVDLKKWAVVACDQYTSEPEYWERVAKFIGDDYSPSTLRIIFPEVFLDKGNDEEIIERISSTMKEYEENEIFVESDKSGIVVVERTFRDGTMRRGVVVALDLEKYDYKPNSQTIIRATEKTIESRIPPRLKVRRNVSIELPHIIVLIDDPEDAVLGSLVAHIEETKPEPEYDTDLMENSGHITGYFIEAESVLKNFADKLFCLKDQQKFDSKYGLDEGRFSPLVFAMGDGNHSLATAKAWWEEVNKSLPEEDLATHPARFALVEIQNCQDPTLVFEPINRLVFTAFGEELLNDFKTWLDQSQGPILISEGQDEYDEVMNNVSGPSKIGYMLNGGCGCIHISNPEKVLPVATFTDFIDPWLAAHSKEAKIDYVHETTAIEKFCESGKTNIGFVFPSMVKSDLFRTVILEGVLPRKTFSMGSSHDKRFYFEGKRIV